MNALNLPVEMIAVCSPEGMLSPARFRLRPLALGFFRARVGPGLLPGPLPSGSVLFLLCRFSSGLRCLSSGLCLLPAFRLPPCPGQFAGLPGSGYRRFC